MNLLEAMYDIKEFCDDIPWGECHKCPLNGCNNQCIVGVPFDWEMTEIRNRIEQKEQE